MCVILELLWAGERPLLTLTQSRFQTYRLCCLNIHMVAPLRVLYIMVSYNPKVHEYLKDLESSLLILFSVHFLFGFYNYIEYSWDFWKVFVGLCAKCQTGSKKTVTNFIICISNEFLLRQNWQVMSPVPFHPNGKFVPSVTADRRTRLYTELRYQYICAHVIRNTPWKFRTRRRLGRYKWHGKHRLWTKFHVLSFSPSFIFISNRALSWISVTRQDTNVFALTHSSYAVYTLHCDTIIQCQPNKCTSYLLHGAESFLRS